MSSNSGTLRPMTKYNDQDSGSSTEVESEHEKISHNDAVSQDDSNNSDGTEDERFCSPAESWPDDIVENLSDERNNGNAALQNGCTSDSVNFKMFSTLKKADDSVLDNGRRRRSKAAPVEPPKSGKLMSAKTNSYAVNKPNTPGKVASPRRNVRRRKSQKLVAGSIPKSAQSPTETAEIDLKTTSKSNTAKGRKRSRGSNIKTAEKPGLTPRKRGRPPKRPRLGADKSPKLVEKSVEENDIKRKDKESNPQEQLQLQKETKDLKLSSTRALESDYDSDVTDIGGEGDNPLRIPSDVNSFNNNFTSSTVSQSLEAKLRHSIGTNEDVKSQVAEITKESADLLKRTELRTKDRSRRRSYIDLLRDESFNEFKQRALHRLSHAENCQIDMSDPAQPAAKLHRLLSSTIDEGESHTAVLVGPPGSRKSAITEAVIQRLRNAKRRESGLKQIAANKSENTADKHKLEVIEQDQRQASNFFVIKLDGRVQINSKQAMMEISRQVAVNIDDELNNDTHSFSDCLTKLFAVLDNNLASQDSLEEMMNVPIIFILDKFEKFVQHTRQIVLYNLFDLCQTRNSPVAVIGITSKPDCTTNLEKRVKSRFSNRMILFSLPKTVQDFRKELQTRLEEPEMIDDSADRQVAKHCWNQLIEERLNTDPIASFVEYTFCESKSIDNLSVRLLPIIAGMNKDDVVSKEKLNLVLHILSPEVDLASRIEALSLMEISVLIAAARLCAINQDSYTTKQIFTQYEEMIVNANVSQNAHSKAVTSYVRLWSIQHVLLAIKSLVELGILYSVASSNFVTASNKANRYFEKWLCAYDLLDIRRALNSSSSKGITISKDATDLSSRLPYFVKSWLSL